MKLLKAAIFSAALVSIVTVAANAADPVPTTPANPPQVATNPGLPYSSTRTPGPKVGPSNWIPSPYSAAPDSASDTGSHYAGKGFGPKTN